MLHTYVQRGRHKFRGENFWELNAPQVLLLVVVWTPMAKLWPCRSRCSNGERLNLSKRNKNMKSERLNGIKQLPLCRAAHHAVAVRFFILQKFIYAICFSSQFSLKIMQLHRSEAGSSQTHAALSFSSCVQASHRTVNGVRWSAQGDFPFGAATGHVRPKLDRRSVRRRLLTS